MSAITIMVVANIVVLGLSFFIMESSQKLFAQEAYLKSLYLFEAGIQGIVYRYAEDGDVLLGERIVSSNQNLA